MTTTAAVDNPVDERKFARGARVRFRHFGREYQGRVTRVRRTRAEVTFMTKGDRAAHRLPHIAVKLLRDLIPVEIERSSS